MGDGKEAIPRTKTIMHRPLKKKILPWDSPGGPVVKNPPSNAGDAGSIPGRGTKIPHAAGQLSTCTTTTEPACLN